MQPTYVDYIIIIAFAITTTDLSYNYTMVRIPAKGEKSSRFERIG